MTPRHKILLLAAVTGHLALVVAVGGLDVRLREYGPFGKLLDVYGELSGVGSGYGYFAPKVATPASARFTLVDDAGRTVVDTLLPRVTREADIRVEDLVAVLDSRGIDDTVRAQLAASWAAALFARYPHATSAVVDMGRWRAPSMAEAREGKERRWKSVYRARVARSRGAAGGSP